MREDPQGRGGGVLLILNPAARHGRAAALEPLLRAQARSRAGWVVRVTREPGEARDFAAGAAEDVVVAVGGDGTVHEVVNGLMARPAGDRPVLATVPAGSGDDYSTTLRIPRRPRSALAVVEAGRTRAVDVARCNGVWFMNSFSLGLDARVSAYVESLKERTAQTGLPLYFRGLMHVLFKDYRVLAVRITVDGEERFDARVLLLAAGIGPTYGGGFRIVPEAVVDDGLLDVMTVDGIPLGDALWRLPFVVTGHHLGMKPVTLRRARSILVESPVAVIGQLDGELMEAERFDITLEPHALRVVVP